MKRTLTVLAVAPLLGLAAHREGSRGLELGVVQQGELDRAVRGQRRAQEGLRLCARIARRIDVTPAHIVPRARHDAADVLVPCVLRHAGEQRGERRRLRVEVVGARAVRAERVHAVGQRVAVDRDEGVCVAPAFECMTSRRGSSTLNGRFA